MYMDPKLKIQCYINFSLLCPAILLLQLHRLAPYITLFYTHELHFNQNLSLHSELAFQNMCLKEFHLAIVIINEDK